MDIATYNKVFYYKSFGLHTSVHISEQSTAIFSKRRRLIRGVMKLYTIVKDRKGKVLYTSPVFDSEERQMLFSYTIRALKDLHAKNRSSVSHTTVRRVGRPKIHK